MITLEPRALNYVLYDGSVVTLQPDDGITVQLFYRSVETGVYGAITTFYQNSFEDDILVDYRTRMDLRYSREYE